MRRPGIADVPVVGRLADRLALDPGSSCVRLARASVRGNPPPGLAEYPAIVLLDRTRNKVVALGQEAAEIALGTLPDHLRAVRPIQRGVIAEPEIARIMFSYYLKRVTRGVGRPSLIVGMPAAATAAERMVMMGVLLAAGAGRVRVLPSQLAAGLALGLPIAGSRPRLLINVGVGAVDLALCALNQVIMARSIPFAGAWFDLNIVRHFQRERGEVLPLELAERAKRELGALDDSKEDAARVSFSSIRLLHHTSYIDISAEEVSQAIKTSMRYLIDELRWFWLELDGRTREIIAEDGATVLGGAAQLPGFFSYLNNELEFTCQPAEGSKPVISGLSQVAANPGRFKLALEARPIS